MIVESEGRFYERGAANNLGNRSEFLRLMRFVLERRELFRPWPTRGWPLEVLLLNKKENVFLRYRNQRSASRDLNGVKSNTTQGWPFMV